ncbi:MAG: hypothetical protein NZM00_07955, partial [Anaerolinea sp.]|nr:hypothetical protein [Anaerolinea sp.]
MPAPNAVPAAHKPLIKPIRNYLDTIADLDRATARTEGSTRRAFSRLLVESAAALKKPWTLVEEYPLRTVKGSIRWDGVFKDELSLIRGFWEAKDTEDRLDIEIARKRDRGYALDNSIFEDTVTAVLFQDGREILRADLRQPDRIADLLVQFFTYTEPDIERFEQAVAEFSQRVPELARGLLDRIAEGHRSNRRFQAAYESLFTLCRNALDPNIARETVDEMLAQHLLTERLIRTIFDNPDFRTQNVIASEIEKV